MVGKHPPSKADPAANTLLSPSPPEHGAEPAAPEVPTEPGARSSERIIPSVSGSAADGCLVRHEVRAYLGRRCPAAVRARVDRHVAECAACRQWVRHLDDHILEYMGGQGPEEELARMDAHLDACDACRELMHHLVRGMAQSWDGNDPEAPAHSSTTFVAGSVVNSRYQIQSFLGRGGMGEVYEAFDQLMDRRVALKAVSCTVADRPRASRRFKEEVRNAQRVGHPHVCRINELQEHHDGGLAPALPFFTMEFIEGERLGHRLQSGPIPLEQVRIIALQLLAGLAAAHERGVLHLDFKSDNVMLRGGGALPDAVIMDFGLSRVLGGESRLRTSDRRQFAGTLSYMSVEQLEGRGDVGPATDVYAFGVVLYEMLTQGLPFYAESLGASLVKQLKQRPKPPSQFAPELSPALDRFVLKCLSNDAQLRYADAGQALSALQAIGPWSRSRGLGRSWKLAGAVAVAVLGALLAVLGLRSTDRAGPEAAPMSALPEPPAATAPSSAAPTPLERVTHALAPAPPPGDVPSALPDPPASAPAPAVAARTPASTTPSEPSSAPARATPPVSRPAPEAPSVTPDAQE